MQSLGTAIRRIGNTVNSSVSRVTSKLGKQGPPAAGSPKSFSDRIGNLTATLKKNKGKVAAVTVAAGSVMSVAAAQEEGEIIEDNSEYIETNKCDKYGNMNPFRDCIKSCPVDDPEDPCIKNLGCYDKDINGDPIYKDIDLKKQCNEELLRQSETSDYEKNFLEQNVPDEPDDPNYSENNENIDEPTYPDNIYDPDDPPEEPNTSNEPIPIESETTLDKSDIPINIKPEVESKSIKTKIDELKAKINKKKEKILKNDSIDLKSDNKNKSTLKSKHKSTLYSKINEYMDPRIFAIALLIIVWLIYQIVYK